MGPLAIPRILDPEGIDYNLLDETKFDLVFLEKGVVRVAWLGSEPLLVSRIINATGDDLPVLGNPMELAVGAKVEIPPGRISRIQATGDVIRNGQVVTDA